MTDSQPTCFIIMPITTPDSMLDHYGKDKDHFTHVLNHLFIPAIKDAGFSPIPPSATGSENIQGKIINALETAALVLCDISCLNPNVFFEFGIRTALNKPVALVKDDLTSKIPFDPSILHCHTYQSLLAPWTNSIEMASLSKHMADCFKTSNGKNNLWKYFGYSISADQTKKVTEERDKIEFLTMEIHALRRSIEESRKDMQSEISVGVKYPKDSAVNAIRDFALSINFPIKHIEMLPGNKIEVIPHEGQKNETLYYAMKERASAYGYSLSIVDKSSS